MNPHPIGTPAWYARAQFVIRPRSLFLWNAWRKAHQYFSEVQMNKKAKTAPFKYVLVGAPDDKWRERYTVHSGGVIVGIVIKLNNTHNCWFVEGGLTAPGFPTPEKAAESITVRGSIYGVQP